MVHKYGRLKHEISTGRVFVLVQRSDISAHIQHKPQQEFFEIDPPDLRKANAVAKAKSGVTDDIAFVFDTANTFYKGGERRI